MVEGQENRPMSCRSRKIGIRQKSTGHRAIYILLGRRLYTANYASATILRGAWQALEEIIYREITDW